MTHRVTHNDFFKDSINSDISSINQIPQRVQCIFVSKFGFLRMKNLLLLVFLSFIATNVYAGAYKCVDVEGKTSFQQKPCAKNTKSSAIELHKTSDSVKQQGQSRRDEVQKYNDDFDKRARAKVRAHYRAEERARRDALDRADRRLMRRQVRAQEDLVGEQKRTTDAQERTTDASNRSTRETRKLRREMEKHNQKAK